jgi:hypothetical protein
MNERFFGRRRSPWVRALRGHDHCHVVAGGIATVGRLNPATDEGDIRPVLATRLTLRSSSLILGRNHQHF